MKKVIHYLRKQPEQTRKHILHISIGAITVIMVVLWGYSLAKSFSGGEVKAKLQNDLKPFSVLKDNITNGYNNISGSVNRATQ